MQEVPVRVAVRVRPLLPQEKLHHHESCVRVLPKANQVVVGKDRTFTFDHVLPGKATQESVYKTCVDGLVTSFFEGYNATVFAYGQTGSGKTFTIGGHNITSLSQDEYGIVPRAISHIFMRMKEHPSREFSLQSSYIEIYKEELRDLLDWETSSKDMNIREDDKGNTFVVGATEVLCQSVEEVFNCLEVGSAHRHTGATNMNEHSSRSHSIFTMSLEQRWSVLTGEGEDDVEPDEEESNDSSMQILSAKFHFVDLAGSERAHKTGNAGERFKESVYINSGLLSLGNVISALGDLKRKATHIPYRDSKITRLLKDSLGGNAKTCMITCISPSSVSFDETLNSLKYSNRARNIKNKPTVNHDRHSSRIAAMQTEIQALRDELERHQLNTAPTHRSELSEPVSELQTKLKRIASQCARYRVCADQAVEIFASLQQARNLSSTHKASFSNWIEIKKEIDETHNELQEEDIEVDQSVQEKVTKLRAKLKKALGDLANDEEIFAEKQRENVKLKDQIEDSGRRCAEACEKFSAAETCIQQQEQRLIDQQTRISELQDIITRMGRKEPNGDGLAEPRSRHSLASLDLPGPRPYSVAADGVRTHRGERPHSRRLHTSPPVFSIDRIVQGFKARSQLIVQELLDSDEVLQSEMADELGSDDDTSDDKSDLTHILSGTKSRNRKNALATLKRTNILKISRKNSKEALEGTQTMDDPACHPNTPRIEESAMGTLRSSIDFNREFIQQSKATVTESRNGIQELALNIRLKEGLIRELVKTGRESEAINKKYSEKISHLEQDVQKARQHLQEAQRALHHLESKEQQGAQDKKKVASEYRKKIVIAKNKVKELERKQQEMEKVVKIQTNSEKRVTEMEAEVGRMKQHMEISQARLKAETERKAKLERELHKDQQKIKELEIRSNQQQKIIKRKTEEVAIATRRLRKGSVGNLNETKDHSQLEEQRKWLDSEVEKVLVQKQEIEDLEQELMRREEILAKREALLKEKGELEMKRVRSSQNLSKDLTSVNSKLNEVVKQLDDKTNILRASRDGHVTKVKGEIGALEQERDQLLKQRSVLDVKLQQGDLLSPREERRLIGLDEGIEALDAAMEFKNDLITSRQKELRSHALTQSEMNLMGRLHSLSKEDTRGLLARYFEKVISLKEQEKKKELNLNEMQIKLDEQQRLVGELNNALQKSRGELERKILEKQMEHEQKLQAVLKQAQSLDGDGQSGYGERRDSDQKLQQLEKDLYYYKKTSRELKKKLREVVASAADSMTDAEGVNRDSLSSVGGDAQNTQRDNSTPRQFTPVRKSKKDIREMSSEEVDVRKSNSRSVSDSGAVKESNPWS